MTDEQRPAEDQVDVERACRHYDNTSWRNKAEAVYHAKQTEMRRDLRVLRTGSANPCERFHVHVGEWDALVAVAGAAADHRRYDQPSSEAALDHALAEYHAVRLGEKATPCAGPSAMDRAFGACPEEEDAKRPWVAADPTLVREALRPSEVPLVHGCPHTPQCRGSAKVCAHLPDQADYRVEAGVLIPGDAQPADLPSSCIVCGTIHAPGHRECLSGDGGSLSPAAEAMRKAPESRPATDAERARHVLGMLGMNTWPDGSHNAWLAGEFAQVRRETIEACKAELRRCGEDIAVQCLDTPFTSKGEKGFV